MQGLTNPTPNGRPGWTMKRKHSCLNETAESPPRDFGALARRISTYTSRTLLSVVVVVAGVVFARQVLEWWGDDAADSHVRPLAADPGHPSAGRELLVGDHPWVIVRHPFQGDAAAASRALLAACQAAADEADGMSLPTPSPEERSLLARLAGIPPDRQTSGGVSLYALPEGFPLVVGTRDSVPSDVVVGSVPSEGQKLAVATWGIAVPTTPTSWSLYTFCPESRSGGQAAAPLQPPLPPGCRRLLHVRSADGHGMIVFTGPPQPEAWKAVFDRWAAEAGLQSREGWREFSGAWRATYRSAAAGGDAAVAIHFGQPDKADHTRGVILVEPQIGLTLPE